MKRLVTLVMLACALVLFIAGCITRGEAYTKKTMADGTVIESRASIMGTGDKASEVAAEGLFADGTDEDLGAGFKKANASQQSTGIEGTLTGMGSLMTGMAKFMVAAQSAKAIPVGPAVEPSPETDDSLGANETIPDETVAANGKALTAKTEEAKATGKPLVVVAGNEGCSYCAKLDSALEAAGFNSRTNIVVYRETSPWAKNTAAKWTGSGNGKFPVVRVTSWDSSGSVTCNKVFNRPQSVADIDAALNTCEAP